MAKILVIDDDDQLLNMIATILQRHEHEVVLESNPERGLSRVIKEQPDVLVLDVMMPRINGHDLCRQIRQTPEIAGLSILMLTARAQPVDRKTALESGADDYLSKPVQARELIDHVEDLLFRGGAPRPKMPAVTISFFGMRGGVGRTTLAVNLAAALRAASEEEACLVDLSPSIGQVVMHFRQQQESSWNDLITTNPLEWDMVADSLLDTPAGLHILAAPEWPCAPETLTATLLQHILLLLQEQMKFVVLDLPPVLTPAVESALHLSDMIFYVVTPDIISVKTAIQSRPAIAELSHQPQQFAYLLNQARPDVELASTTVEKGLKARLGFKIGYDKNQHLALAKGTPLALSEKESPLADGMRRMAQAIWERIRATA